MADRSVREGSSCTQIESIHIIPTESTETQRVFDLTTRDGHTFRRRCDVKPPLTVAIIDSIMAKLDTTLTPHNDLVEEVNAIATVTDSYQRLNGLTAEMNILLSTVHDLLQDALNLLRLAGEIPIPDVFSDVMSRALKVGCIISAQDKFIEASSSLEKFLSLPNVQYRRITAAQLETDLTSIGRAVFIFRLWTTNFETHLFA